jgi:ribosomal protein S12 methylthiotransferase accessory factor
MQMVIDFPGGARVDAHFGPFTLRTDQPASGGGDGTAPTPFATFLASIGTCAGIYVLGFCRQRGLPTDGIRLVQTLDVDPKRDELRRWSLSSSCQPQCRPAVIRQSVKCSQSLSSRRSSTSARGCRAAEASAGRCARAPAGPGPGWALRTRATRPWPSSRSRRGAAAVPGTSELALGVQSGACMRI